MLNDLNLHMYRPFLFQQVDFFFLQMTFLFKHGLLSKVFFNFLSEMCSYAFLIISICGKSIKCFHLLFIELSYYIYLSQWYKHFLKESVLLDLSENEEIIFICFSFNIEYIHTRL